MTKNGWHRIISCCRAVLETIRCGGPRRVKRTEMRYAGTGTGSELTMNAVENALDSLFRAAEHVGRVKDHEFHWKWVIICLHNSLYTFALIFAAGTNWQTVNAIKGIEKRERGEFKAVDFISAIKLCLKRQERFTYSVPFELTRDQKNSVLWLHEFRNRFEHFPPNNIWGVPLAGLPNACVHVLEAIKFRALDCNENSYLLESHVYYAKNSEESGFGPSVSLGLRKKKKIEAAIARSVDALKNSRFYIRDELIKARNDLSKLNI